MIAHFLYYIFSGLTDSKTKTMLTTALAGPAAERETSELCLDKILIVSVLIVILMLLLLLLIMMMGLTIMMR